jgi:hypothetical protein
MRLGRWSTRASNYARSAWLGAWVLWIAACRHSVDPQGPVSSAIPAESGIEQAPDAGQNVQAPLAAAAVAVQQHDASASPTETEPTSRNPARDDAPARTDSLIGLTRDQVRSRRGTPTKEGAKEWVYTPDQPGCRDMIVSEVVTFDRDVVMSVRLQRRQTGKHCEIAPELR